MLVAISDIHLTDGSTSTNVNPSAFSLLKKEILAAKTKNTKEIHILLLGDIFDVVRTDYWFREFPNKKNAKDNPKNKRPWEGIRNPKTGMNNSPETEIQFLEVLELILCKDSGKAFINMLNDLKKDFPCTKITYVIGNHDRVFNNFESMKTRLKEKLTEYDDSTIEFKNYFKSEDYSLLARHGHVWDSECHGVDYMNKVLKPKIEALRFDEEVYKVLTIGEVITAELMSGIIYYLTTISPVQNKLRQNLLDVNNVRPMMDVFSWLQWFGNNLSESVKQNIVDAIIYGLTNVVNNRFAKEWDDIKTDIIPFLTGDIVDNFQDILKVIDGKSFDQIQRSANIAKIIGRIFFPEKEIYYKGAVEEFNEPNNESIKYVMYGHTHEARHDYYTSSSDGNIQLYINTGTFQPLIAKARKDTDFSVEKQMTMVYFYNNNDIPGLTAPSVDIWNGFRKEFFI